jgi:hypothetical protein
MDQVLDKTQDKLQFSIGEKLVIDGAHFIVTNLGTYPKGQPMQISMPGDEQAFNVDINGCRAIFRESQIRMLLNAAKAYNVVPKEDNLEPLNKKR